jgi:DNA-binding transcriptional MerR regulator
MPGLLIGQVVERTGVTAPTIRYYERLGLLTAPPRTAAGYRRYGDSAIEELQFIRKAQALGFTLEEIAEIMRLGRSGKATCSRVLSLARQHVVALDERIRNLTRFRGQLAAAISGWDGEREPTCRGLCRIITEADAPEDNPDPAPVVPSRRRGRPGAMSGRAR